MTRQTRFQGLGYEYCGGLWGFVDMQTDAHIGYWYHSRAELLGDLERFATERGFN